MQASSRATGRIAALDLGEVRTGVALSDPSRTIARPVEVVASEKLEEYLRGLLEDEGVEEILVGVPKTLGGEVGFQARRVLATLGHLKTVFAAVTFIEWDERFTTRMSIAGPGGGSTGRSRKRDRTSGTGGRVDHLAAARMLQEYLETRGNL
ncbi:MAG TPA: Holliday junction resolvase RuvX [Rubrobacteraceae bacterium]|nr:Holliday junction resolvase RuvX [Rubrobacteraceae bacterium]